MSFVLVLTVLPFGTPAATPAFAGSYNRSAALAYADQWTSNTDYGDPVMRNSDYPNFGIDCTNFASQVLYAGGYPPRGSSQDGCYPDEWWKPFWFGWWVWTWSWSVAECQRQYMYRHHEFQSWDISSIYSMEAGDILQMSQDGSGTPTHSRVIVGPGYDIILWTWESQLASQHTTDRKRRYWNIAIDPSWPLWAWHVAW
jgi:hypothetical protein